TTAASALNRRRPPPRPGSRPASSSSDRRPAGWLPPSLTRCDPAARMSATLQRRGAMKRGITLALLVLLASALPPPADLGAQTKDDTIVYAMQSDVQNWDP